ncbi:MAG: hypothetical protein PHQ75_02475 [Thermoguttaceae bacterium]|nr:hypothetical protein [Thermoguttaceae bacterium]
MKTRMTCLEDAVVLLLSVTAKTEIVKLVFCNRIVYGQNLVFAC